MPDVHRAGAAIVLALMVVFCLLFSGCRTMTTALTGFVSGPHGRLRVDDGGPENAEIPVVLVHGNGGNLTQWAGTLSHLRKTRRAIAFDLSGFGESEWKPGSPISVEGFADDVAAVADAAHLSRFVLVGHSYGCAVVTAYAGRHPERIVGLVFADGAGDVSDTPEASLEPLRRGLAERYDQFTEKWFEGILVGSKPETREAVMASLRRTPHEVFSGAFFALGRFHLDAALARYPGPKLSIASMLFDNPAGIHKKHPEILVRHVENASHWLMLDQPEAFQQALDEFLAALSVSTR
jgi:pimeloyl-ACP methyl ester carboxylesterase